MSLIETQKLSTKLLQDELGEEAEFDAIETAQMRSVRRECETRVNKYEDRMAQLQSDMQKDIVKQVYLLKKVTKMTKLYVNRCLFEWNRVAMGLKGSGYITRICEIYIDDVLPFGTMDNEYLSNARKVLGRLRGNSVTANPAKTRLGLK
jgi:hypothetical protein